MLWFTAVNIPKFLSHHVLSEKAPRRASSLMRAVGAGILIAAVAVFLAPAITAQINSLAAPLVGEHDWRQSDTYSVAYNFVHERFDVFHPRIDWAKGRSGVMGMEFPFLQAVAAPFMFLFGDAPSTSRILIFALFVVSLALAARHLREPKQWLIGVGYIVAAFLSPMALYEFRQVQPDPVAASMLALSACAFVRYREVGTRGSYIWGLAAFTAATLVKSPSIGIAPAMWLFAVMGRPVTLPSFVRTTIPFLIPALLLAGWLAWGSHLNAYYNGGEVYFGTHIALEDIRNDLRDAGLMRRFFWNLLPAYVVNWTLMPAWLCGVVLSITPRHRNIGVPMLVWAVLGGLFCGGVGRRMYWHWYYAMVMVIPMLYFCALAIGTTLKMVLRCRGAASRPELWVTCVTCSSLALSRYLGGGPREGGSVTGADLGHGQWLTWCTEFGFFLWLVLVVTSLMLTQLPTRIVRLACITLFGFALAVGMPRARHDALEAFQWRARVSQWDAYKKELRSLRQTADRYSTRADKFVVSAMVNPTFLYRVLRKGWVEDPGTVRSHLAEYQKQGAHFLLHFHGFGESPMPDAIPLHRTSDWSLYCLKPTGCLPR
jgi:hypothetical protein